MNTVEERDTTANMEPLSEWVSSSIGDLSKDKDAARIAIRTNQVHTIYKQAIESTFSTYPSGSIQLLLQHTNAVYITKDDDWKTLIIYVDDSDVKSALDHNQYFIIQSFREQGEVIDEYKLLTARATMRSRHPFETATTENSEINKKQSQKRVLSQKEIDTIDDMVEQVENPAIREALKRAIIADAENKEEI